MKPILELQNISKIYKNKVIAIDNLSLEFNTGIYGILGPNGAGKSTLFKILGTILTPEKGKMLFKGEEIGNHSIQYKRSLGFMPQEFGFYPNFNPVKLLNHFAILKGIKHKTNRSEMVEKILDQTNLWDQRNKKISQFSGGMIRRLGVAQSLLGEPKILLLDEPTAGLDPEERNRFNNLLKNVSLNTTMIISSHLVEDLSNLCNEILIINKGCLKGSGSVSFLKETLQGKLWKVEAHNEEEILLYKKDYKVISEKVENGKNYLVVYEEEVPPSHFLPMEPTLEDVYFHYLKLN